ncbi:enhancer of filamentation 1-like [Ochlerotatus camptorhynchus]|uniref:enhancer of filamentation 1-like n=1 Tax=Ochlerotatus camptorhynchus TaxID=644619 RepID=UPI0031E0D7EB
MARNFETMAEIQSTSCNNKYNQGEWPEDYDYVSLESKEASAKSNAEIHDSLPQDLKKNCENVRSTHNQPPKFFLAYGKFVVLSAHNLVNIGNVVHRNASRENVKTRMLQWVDSLSEALKTCVVKTKKAAQHFSSVTAVQEMVDSVVDISHLAKDLKIAMLNAVQQ